MERYLQTKEKQNSPIFSLWCEQKKQTLKTRNCKGRGLWCASDTGLDCVGQPEPDAHWRGTRRDGWCWAGGATDAAGALLGPEKQLFPSIKQVVVQEIEDGWGFFIIVCDVYNVGLFFYCLTETICC